MRLDEYACPHVARDGKHIMIYGLESIVHHDVMRAMRAWQSSTSTPPPPKPTLVYGFRDTHVRVTLMG